MPKATKPQFYAVRRGQVPGVYRTWRETETQVKGYSGAVYKGFMTRAEAEAFVQSNLVPASTATSTSKNNPYTRPPTPRGPVAGVPTKVRAPIETGIEKNGEDGLEVVVDGKVWKVVYTDGACSGNGRAGATGGIGVYWGPGMKNISERLPGAQTNNRAELIALVRALETDPDPAAPLILKTDSSYSIQCMRDWLPKWRKNGFQTSKGPVKNKELLLYLSYLMEERPGHIRLQHVRGHAGVEGNEIADRLAVAGAGLPDVEERDWAITKEEAEEELSQEHVDFEVPPEFVLSEAELAQMEQTQQFD
ncbi:hypothetical protein DACRYDRAFT_19826 [Dacryopinax primogenitus]|uniref:Ribonuclease H n=1 Tax=Dacryopinax primogenitus (strain DJM 731) TaxID=1858805 RepID=M5GAA2_DACPD|nr:uncharacterized protein DACRYDRAFT_19826 [Dacryopinax primogenitus]EJU05260.1 hypothetical protein DACRYDRAFT_19826 [Dacryopinax primogenitus]